MNWQEDDDRDDPGIDHGPWRPRRTKFRSFEEQARSTVGHDKRSGKRSHRQKTIKDDYWPDHDR